MFMSILGESTISFPREIAPEKNHIFLLFLFKSLVKNISIENVGGVTMGKIVLTIIHF